MPKQSERPKADEFDPEARAALGSDRVKRLDEALTALAREVASAPDRASWFVHLPIPLKSSDAVSASAEITKHVERYDPGGSWFMTTGVHDDGKRFALASDKFALPSSIAPKDVASFLLFDLHARLISFGLSHLWRAADFAGSAYASLAAWEILPAAASARALLEGVAAFAVEGHQLGQQWNEFKKSGDPSVDSAEAFRKEFGNRLVQAQFGTRVGERSGAPGRLRRTNVLTLVEKFAKLAGDDLWDSYEWLCDAVHPSFGSQTVFVATQGRHPTGAIFAADIARRSYSLPTQIPKIDPTVARAAIDATALAVQHLLPAWRLNRWLASDLGMTTGASFRYAQPTIGSLDRPKRNDRCPCGSGRKYKACVHDWGMPAEEPATASSTSADD
jgi:hypothetical protein